MFSVNSDSSLALDDITLVGASLKGDREAFAQIVTRYQGLVAAIATARPEILA